MASLTPTLGARMLLRAGAPIPPAAWVFFVCDTVQSPVWAVARSLPSLFKLLHASDSLTK